MLNNNNNNNSNNEKIFFKLFKNIIIKNNIFYYIHQPNDKFRFSYNGTTSLNFMLKYDRYEMILDKLKSNHFIYIDLNGIILLEKLITQKPKKYDKIIEISNYINKIYNNHINNIFLNNDQLLKDFIINNKLINYNNNNSNNNKLKSFYQYYKLYSNLETELSKNNLNVKVVKDIYKEIINQFQKMNNSNNGQNDNSSSDSGNNINKRQKLDNDFIGSGSGSGNGIVGVGKNKIFKEELNESEIVELIGSNEIIPIFSKLNLGRFLERVTNDKVEFIEKELNLDIGTILQSSEFIEVECIFNDKVLNECIEKLLVNSKEYQNISLHRFYSNNVKHAIIHILVQIRNYFIYEPSRVKFIEHLKNSYKTIDLQSLILISELYIVSGASTLNRSSRELFLDSCYIYHYLHHNNFKKIEVNYSLNRNFYLPLVLAFSVFKKSIDSYKFFSKCLNSLLKSNFNFYRNQSLSISNYYENVSDKDQLDLKSGLDYFNFIFKYRKEDENLTVDGILYFTISIEIFKITIVYFNSNYIKYYLNSCPLFKKNYMNLLENHFTSMFSFHFSKFNNLKLYHLRHQQQTQSPNLLLKDDDIQKIFILFDNLYFLKDSSKVKDSIKNLVIQSNQLNQFHQLFIQFILHYSNGDGDSSANNQDIQFSQSQIEFITSLYKKVAVLLDIDKLIDINNSLNSIVNNNDNNKNSFTLIINNKFNKNNNNFNNIFNKNLINSIINRDYSSIIKLIQFLNNNNNNISGSQIQDDNNLYSFVYNESFNYKFKLINYLIQYGLIATLDLKLFFKKIFKNNLIIDNIDQLLQLIPESDSFSSLREYFIKKFKKDDLITLKYSADDIFEQQQEVSNSDGEYSIGGNGGNGGNASVQMKKKEDFEIFNFDNGGLVQLLEYLEMVDGYKTIHNPFDLTDIINCTKLPQIINLYTFGVFSFDHYSKNFTNQNNNNQDLSENNNQEINQGNLDNQNSDNEESDLDSQNEISDSSEDVTFIGNDDSASVAHKDPNIKQLLMNGGYENLLKYIQEKSLMKISIGDEELVQFTICTNISIEWFEKLYDPLIKYYLMESSSSLIMLYLSHRNPQIFEYLWNNHLDSIIKKQGFLETIFFKVFKCIESLPQLYQIIDYILKEKKEFILALKLESGKINEIFKNCLVKAPLSTFKLIQTIFSDFKFKIDFNVLRDIIFIKYKISESSLDPYSRYDVIEYLYESNQINNLKELIGIGNLDRIKFKNLKKIHH